ncbi:MAG: Txe/YoeB family addiction module toxin [Akkermansia sp.]
MSCPAFKVIYSTHAEEDLRFWATSNKKTFKKIVFLLEEMMSSPYQGIGKPKPLRYEWSGCYSRRIDSKNRIVYKVNDEEKIIFVYMLRHHY